MDGVDMEENLKAKSRKLKKDGKPVKSRRFLLCVLVTLILLLMSIGVALYFILRPQLKEQILEEVLRNSIVLPCPKYGSSDEFTKESCEQTKLKCVWRNFNSSTGIPFNCTMSDDDSGRGWSISYEAADSSTITVRMERSPQSIELLLKCRSSNQLQIKISDRSKPRFEVPEEALPSPDNEYNCSQALYNVQFIREQRLIEVTHKNMKMFSMKLDGNFIFDDQFIMATIRLNSSTSYGFGEHNHKQLKLDMNYRTWSIFTRDVAPVDNWNLYGAQPYFMNVHARSQSVMGVLLKNSNAMDVFLQPDPFPAVTYRIIGGILDFHILFADNPESLTQSYTSLIGKPLMPPYWSLGFQLSRWGYTNLDHVKSVVERNRAAGIPLDVIYGDIDYMRNKLIFTYDTDNFNGLPDYVNDLKANGTKYIIILDPGIGIEEEARKKVSDSYKALKDGEIRDVYIKAANGSILVGKVWPGLVYYPDFTNPNTTHWWREQIQDFYYNGRNVSDAGIKFDALWIDMNEPSSFYEGKEAESVCDMTNPLNKPPYKPENMLGGSLVDKTICMDANQHWGKHYDVHSLYGHSMSISTYQALSQIFPAKRPFVLTRSTFPGTSKYAIHWLGDNQSQWRQLPWSIVSMLEFSMFGFSMTGSDICGFWFNTTEHLCQRWMQVGAFYPFARNHNAGYDGPYLHLDQDPANFGEAMIKSSRDALLTRYKLLPYLYTLLFRAHEQGSTVARPLFHEFMEDENTHTIDRQFLWGPALLISPVLDESDTVTAYIPDGVWYNYYTGQAVKSKSSHVLATPRNKINLHVRGGYVIPWQHPAINTELSKKNAFGLLVCLNQEGNAEGELYIDDGESSDPTVSGNYTLLSFACSGNTLKINQKKLGYTSAPNNTINEIQVFGINTKVNQIRVNGIMSSDFVYSDQVLVIHTSISYLQTNHTVEWSSL